MFADQVRAAVDGARTIADLEPLTRALWQAFGADAVTETEAEALCGLIEGRKAVLRGMDASKGTKAPLGPTAARRMASYSRGLSFERRRRLAASGPMPPALAASFTVGELAALRIVRDEVAAKGSCDRTVGEIAARAGVSASTVRNALRCAARLGLMAIQERRVAYDRNLPNLVTIISREWLAWIGRGTTRKADGGWMQKAEAYRHQGSMRGVSGLQTGNRTTRNRPAIGLGKRSG